MTMKLLCYFFIALALSLVGACGDEAGNTSYVLFDEDVIDAPAKTQIVQHFVLSEIPSEASLKAELLRRYKSAASRTGFVHHSRPTNIYIYVYGSEEKAAAEQGLWIGMLAKSPMENGEPQITVNSYRLEALSAREEDRFGLSEAERQRVFRAVVEAERRAMSEAMAQVPDPEFLKQAELQGELTEKYRSEVADEFDLAEDQLLEISVEGLNKGWVMPSAQ